MEKRMKMETYWDDRIHVARLLSDVNFTSRSDGCFSLLQVVAVTVDNLDRAGGLYIGADRFRNHVTLFWTAAKQQKNLGDDDREGRNHQRSPWLQPRLAGAHSITSPAERNNEGRERERESGPKFSQPTKKTNWKTGKWQAFEHYWPYWLQ